jgi:putative oxidoreductase
MEHGKFRNSLEGLALTLLRISTGVIMATHGWQKFNNIAGTTEAFTSLGLPYPNIAVYLAIAGELLGGLGLLLGLMTPLAALGVAATMGVAVFKVHFKNGLLASDNGFEYPLTLMLVALFFVMRGAGPVSLDAMFCRKKHPETLTPS